ncbi:MAG TPA: 2-oxoacid:acceptor oxidoreductase family protein [Planctomycetota bacterium]|nr:2-oxoacid:acceptor oxidoreductase family protein [Planctomycetota bacterium]
MAVTSTAAPEKVTARYPGTLMAIDGNTAIVLCETAASEAAGAYPISPSSQMGEGFAEAMARGELNAFGRPLIFIEPEGEHAAAGVTAGMSMAGLRACNFSSGQGVAYMHESLYAAAGKRLPYVLNIGCRAMTKQSLNVHAGHDDFHTIDDTGFFQTFAKNAQQAADLNLIVRKTAELSLTPGIVGMDGWLTSHVLETVRVPERDLVREFLGSPDEEIDCPTAAQRMVFGPKRRRVPRLWDTDNPAQVGVVQNQDSYAQGVAAQRPFFFDHVEPLGRQSMQQYFALTGRKYDFVLPYRCEDAEYVLVGFGSMAENAEAAVDHLRDKRGIKVGCIQVVWYRPFPGPQLAELLKGRKGVAVLERTDQPLAVDLPLVREVRCALQKAQENGRALADGPDRALPHRGYPPFRSLDECPRVYSGSYGLGSRDLQPGQIIGAVENMLDGAPKRPFFYLGVEFVQKNPPSPARKAQQDKMLADYPHLADLAIEGSENPSLLPEQAISFRIHSIGGWGAVTTGKNLSVTMFDLLGLHLKCNPKYGGEKKGAPTTYYGAFARERIRVNCELQAIDVVLSPDPNVFQHTDALHGLRQNGAIVIQTATGTDPAQVWKQFPPFARKIIEQKDIEVYYVDAFGIAKKESTNPDLELRMQGTVFQGAFFRVSPVLKTFGLDEERLMKSIEGVLDHKFGAKGRAVVDDNMRVVKRGFDETKKLDWRSLVGVEPHPPRPPRLPISVQHASPETQTPLTRPDRFFEQVGKFYTEGHGDDGLADPFAAFSFTPAVTGTFRDMTQIRFEYPKFIPENCTGCSKCWTQCPDSSIPGLVVKLPDLVKTAARRVAEPGKTAAIAQVAPKIEAALRAKIKAAPEGAVPANLAREAVLEVATGEAPEVARSLEAEADKFRQVLVDFPVAKTKPFFDAFEKKGAGALLAITVNPESCKGCMECVEVCGDGALVRTPQDEAAVAHLRRGWETWLDLPDTDSNYIKITDLDKAAGVLPSLLLAKKSYFATVGGDGACMGCGEKTPIHLLCSVADALMQPRVHAYVTKLDALIKQIDAALPTATGPGKARLEASKKTLEDVAWRYKKGPTGRGRSTMGMVNSTGCTTVWGSTYPYNPYPFPWANHLFQDAPSVAMGIFEGHARQMADGFKAVRTAELELAGKFDKKSERQLALFDWKDFSDDELRMLPPVIVLGGDGAMLDIGFQNLSRMLISGRPIKVLVVDTQVYSNTGGQVCTSGFIGQISDMAMFGEKQQGKTEPRKEIGLMAIAHRGVYTAQTSQAHANHMLKTFIDGMNSKRPALWSCYTTCQPEHGVADDASARQAKLALEGRAFPFFIYDPDKGPTMKDRLSLTANPAPNADWPTYALTFVNDQGVEEKKQLPMTFADFAATEGRFGKHFTSVKEGTPEDALVPFDQYVALPKAARAGKTPFIWATRRDKKLRKLVASQALVASAEERLDFWRLLQDLSGNLPQPAKK